VSLAIATAMTTGMTTVLRVSARVVVRVVVRVVGAPPGDPLGPVDQDPDRIRDEACRLVAADRVCSPPKPPKDLDPPSSLGWIGSVLQALVWIVFIALVVALVVLLVRAAMGLGGRGRRRRRTVVVDEPEVEVLGGVLIDTSREPADWRRDADAHRAAGRYRDALRCRYRALVGDLARGGLIDEIPGRTTGEERVQLADVAAVAAPPFDRVAELFDSTWYGDRPASDADVAEVEHLEAQVLQLMAQLPPEAGPARQQPTLVGG
jgi:hypothetical protein